MTIKVAPRKWDKPTYGRECGSCYACCVYLGIEELKKPTNVKCCHLTGSGHKRCGIYEHRPTACREYACAWKGGWGPEWLKPEKSGMLITLYDEEEGPGATINIFDPNKTSVKKVNDVIANLLFIGCASVREINLVTKFCLLYKGGYIYKCRLLETDDVEELKFEQQEIPVGRYRTE